MSNESSDAHRHTNALIHETSPYLLQHAHNPVDWHAWGEEAFAKAARENKPIFLSVGYSTCYWCHVMERQSFENEAIAAEMNRLFVCIKVDREERPDVDQLYMTAVQVQTRQGGWPMSVFLTPGLRYFYGGTYFPPTDAYGRPGFLTLLRAISDAWHNRRGDVEQTAAQFLQILRQASQPPAPTEPVTFDRNTIESLIEQSTSDYDPRHGGFGGAPKFPRQTVLELLLAFLKDDGSRQSDELRDRIARQLIHTLDAMADGGIRDHLGGGFHRYSTDARWLVPHFEIMLYDNAMLGWIYAEAFAQFGHLRHQKAARGIFDFILREMTSPDGGFYTAFDAEVDAQEGLSYLWTPAQIGDVLGREDAELFNRVYGVSLGPNFADPHHGSGEADKNILYFPVSLEKIASELKIDAGDLETRLAPMRQKLLAARAQRKQPLLDTKILTSWNALMIRALAHGGKVFDEPRYISAAQRAADFLLQHHRRDDGLYRTSRDGKAKYSGFLDDYAALAQALLALHDATTDARWLDEARSIAKSMLARFGDNRPGLFFTDADAKDLEVRQKTASDSPLPSGNALAALSLLELDEFDAAGQIIGAFVAQMMDYGAGMSAIVQAAMNYVARRGPLRVDPPAQASDIALGSSTSAQETVRATAKWQNDREILLSLEILDGFHINANDVSSVDAQLVATRVAVIGHDDASIDYPPAQMQRFAYSEESIPVYSGKVQIIIRLPDKSLRTPSQLSLTFQACSDSACLAPVTKTIETLA